MKRKSYDDDEKISLEVRRDRCSEVTRLLAEALISSAFGIAIGILAQDGAVVAERCKR